MRLPRISASAMSEGVGEHLHPALGAGTGTISKVVVPPLTMMLSPSTHSSAAARGDGALLVEVEREARLEGARRERAARRRRHRLGAAMDAPQQSLLGQLGDVAARGRRRAPVSAGRSPTVATGRAASVCKMICQRWRSCIGLRPDAITSNSIMFAQSSMHSWGLGVATSLRCKY